MHFPHTYTQNHSGVLIFMGRAGRKYKYVPQLHHTDKTDRNFGFENIPSLPECLEMWVM